jgi:acyl-coenzyme A thioesterase PaaI-like protein
VELPNARRVQNHVGGVHACAAVLAAESASGCAVALHLGPGQLPLLKSMDVRFLRRAQGALRAVAALTPAQRAAVGVAPRGEVAVAVRVTDESGAAPLEATFVWAWVPQAKL